MKKKLLIIEKSNLLGFFLKNKLSDHGIDVHITKNGFDGLIKMRNELPDVIIIDYNLPKMSIDDFLKEKSALKTTKDIPIILLYSKSNSFNKQTILNFAKYKLYKLVVKPVEIDQLLGILENIFLKKFEIDTTNCFLDIHLNEDFLFIEISKGINLDKLELIKYRILEIKQTSLIKKVIIIMTSIDYERTLNTKLDIFMNNILVATGSTASDINFLTGSSEIKNYYLTNSRFKSIGILKNIEAVTDRIKNYSNENNLTMSRDEKQENTHEHNFDLKFNNEKIKDLKPKIIRNFHTEKDLFNIAVIDDDLRILEFMEILLSKKEWNINTYVDGAIFIENLRQKKPDLIFLDLMLPTMSGFEILEYLSLTNFNIPIIIISALYNKELLLKANKLGVTNFIVKPLKPEIILKRAEEFYFKKMFDKKEVLTNDKNESVEIFVS